MNKPLLTLALAAIAATAAISTNAQTGNFGIGAAAPSTKLDISGALTNRQAATPVVVSGATVTMPVRLTNSQYQLTGTPGTSFTITGPVSGDASGAPTMLQYGARMILINNTDATGTLNGFPVASKQAVEYVWGNNGANGWIATNGGYVSTKTDTTSVVDPTDGAVVSILDNCGFSDITTGGTYIINGVAGTNGSGVDTVKMKTAMAVTNLIGLRPTATFLGSAQTAGSVMAGMPSPSGYIGKRFVIYFYEGSDAYNTTSGTQNFFVAYPAVNQASTTPLANQIRFLFQEGSSGPTSTASFLNFRTPINDASMTAGSYTYYYYSTSSLYNYYASLKLGTTSPHYSAGFVITALNANDWYISACRPTITYHK